MSKNISITYTIPIHNKIGEICREIELQAKDKYDAIEKARFMLMKDEFINSYEVMIN